MPTFGSTTTTCLRLTLVMWCVVLAFVAPAQLLTGQVTTVAEALVTITGFLTGLGFAGVLFLVFRAASGRSLMARILILALAVVVLSVVQTIADFSAQFVIRALLGHVTPPPVNVRTVLLTTLIYLCIYSANTAVFWIVDSWQETRKQALELAESRARSAVFEMETLRLQLDPHFLGNALNGISSLIVTGRTDQASEMTDKLAVFLQSSIENRGLTVPLRDEIDTLEAYVGVEAARFGDRLHVAFRCDEAALDARTPQFILQPLIENAVKYAVAPSQTPVHIVVEAAVEADSLLLKVTDDGKAAATAPCPSPGPGHGIGLRNTRNRLAVQYGAAASMEAGPTDTGFSVVIRLPFESARVARDEALADV